MKTLAFITALFLPGTFIASLFSTNMFDWKPSLSYGPEQSPTMSPFFWVYWVVTVPLTSLVLMGWFWWYKRADTAHRQIFNPMTGYVHPATKSTARRLRVRKSDLGDLFNRQSD